MNNTLRCLSIFAGFFLASTCFAQEPIKLSLLSSLEDDTDFMFALPIAGTQFSPKFSGETLRTNQHFNITTEASPSGVYFMRIASKPLHIYLDQGDQLKVYVEKDKEENTQFRFEGDNADGHLLFSKFHRPFYEELGASYLREYKTPELSRENILSRMDRDIRAVDSLHTIGKISENYQHWAKASVASYYRSVAASTLYGLAKNLKSADSTINVDRDAIEAYSKHWKETIGDYDFTDPWNRKTPNFFTFISDRNSWLHGLVDTERLEARASTKNLGGYGEYLYYYNNLYTKDGEHKEFVLAESLSLGVQQKGYETSLIQLFESFRSKYPNSLYTDALTPHIEEITAFRKKADADFPEEVHFVKNYETIDTFDEILELFNDRTVYIDLWATWCGPCKQEFNEGQELKDFAKKQDIDMLYISIDRPSAHDKWQDMIKFYDLNGHHLLASQNLVTDIRNRFGEDYGGQKGLSIPRYIIIKNGEIAVDNAKRPSAKQQLIDQLTSFL